MNSNKALDEIWGEERRHYASHGPYFFNLEVFNDDYQQLPLDVVAQRARKIALWLNDTVLRKPAPLPAWAFNSFSAHW